MFILTIFSYSNKRGGKTKEKRKDMWEKEKGKKVK
jgi:hypothetical protein